MIDSSFFCSMDRTLRISTHLEKATIFELVVEEHTRKVIRIKKVEVWTIVLFSIAVLEPFMILSVLNLDLLMLLKHPYNHQPNVDIKSHSTWGLSQDGTVLTVLSDRTRYTHAVTTVEVGIYKETLITVVCVNFQLDTNQVPDGFLNHHIRDREVFIGMCFSFGYNSSDSFRYVHGHIFKPLFKSCIDLVNFWLFILNHFYDKKILFSGLLSKIIFFFRENSIKKYGNGVLI